MLSFVQFPWRFLTIISFAMSFLGGAIILVIKKPAAKKLFLILIVASVIFMAWRSSPKPTFIDYDGNIEDFLALGEGEYTPKWVIIPPDGPTAGRFEVFSGKGRLATEKTLDPVHYQTEFQALQPSLLYCHTFYFPGWQVFVDGRWTEPNIDNPYGMILFKVPVGAHDIQVIFGSTPIRTAGMMISWLGFGLLLLCGILNLTKKLIT